MPLDFLLLDALEERVGLLVFYNAKIILLLKKLGERGVFQPPPPPRQRRPRKLLTWLRVVWTMLNQSCIMFNEVSSRGEDNGVSPAFWRKLNALWYPYRGTTHSASGVTQIRQVYDLNINTRLCLLVHQLTLKNIFRWTLKIVWSGLFQSMAHLHSPIAAKYILVKK